MATMDLVKYYGGEPANFLDIGGSSDPDKVVAALEIITSDLNVKSILFNIFGGNHPLRRRRERKSSRRRVGSTSSPPIVIRLTGTNEELALEILREAGFSAYTSMDDVVEKSRPAGGCIGMSIFIDSDTKLVVQGITGREGSFHTREMMEYGTQVVAGVTPGKGGRTFEGPDGETAPIFNSMDEAVDRTGANASVIYVPPAFRG